MDEGGVSDGSRTLRNDQDGSIVRLRRETKERTNDFYWNGREMRFGLFLLTFHVGDTTSLLDRAVDASCGIESGVGCKYPPKRTLVTLSAAERGQRREIRMEFQRFVRDQT